MADGLVLTRRVSERGVHETAQRAGAGRGEAVVRHYVGYEEWPEAGFLRREVARHGVALILGFGDNMDVFEDEFGSPVRRLGAFVVGNQSRSGVTGVGGHQLGVQVELTPAGALALFGAVEDLNDTVVPLDEALGARGARLVERLAETPTWETRLDLLDDELGAGALVSAAFGSAGRGGGGGEEVPALAPEVAWLRRQLLATNGRARVEPLMDETGWSRRHVTEHFRRQLGVPPKTFARLVRFEHAGALLAAPPRPYARRGGDGSRLLRPVAPHAGVRRPGRGHPGRLRRRLPGSPPRSGLSKTPNLGRCTLGAMTTTNDTTTPPTNDTTTPPSGRSAVIPVLVYEDIEAAHDYLVDVFGFTSGGLHRLDDGTVVHAEVRHGRRRHLAAPGDARARDGVPA